MSLLLYAVNFIATESIKANLTTLNPLKRRVFVLRKKIDPAHNILFRRFFFFPSNFCFFSHPSSHVNLVLQGIDCHSRWRGQQLSIASDNSCSIRARQQLPGLVYGKWWQSQLLYPHKTGKGGFALQAVKRRAFVILDWRCRSFLLCDLFFPSTPSPSPGCSTL